MKRRKRDHAGGGVDLAIIITPMLDMAFQLLAFFIMTYQPPASEAAVDGSLLPASQAKAAGSSDRAGLRVIVQATPAGECKAIYLQKPSDLEPKPVYSVGESGDFTQALKTLGETLAKCRDLPEGKSLPVYLDADRALRYGPVIAVQDVIRSAGFKTIGFSMGAGQRKPPGEQ